MNFEKKSNYFLGRWLYTTGLSADVVQFASIDRHLKIDLRLQGVDCAPMTWITLMHVKYKSEKK